MALVCVGVVLAIGLAGCDGTASEGGADSNTIRVGAKDFTEQFILGELMAQLLESRTDLNVERRFGLGTMIAHRALEHGEIDLYAEYTGTALLAVLKLPVMTDADAAFAAVDEAYRARFDSRWLGPLGFNNTYALTVRQSDAKSRGWSRLSDLVGQAATLRAGFTSEFMERPDGYRGLAKAYGLDFAAANDMDPGLMYKAVAQGEVDVICAFATDGRIAAYNLHPLEDDKQFFPPYQAAIVLRQSVAASHPQVVEVLSELSGRLDDQTMQRLNYQVDHDKGEPALVAARWLREQGLLKR